MDDIARLEAITNSLEDDSSDSGSEDELSSPSPTLEAGQKDPLSLSSKQSQEEAHIGQDPLASPAKESQLEIDSGHDKELLSSPAKLSREETEIGLDNSDSLSSPTKESQQEIDSGHDKDPMSSPAKQSQQDTNIRQDKDPLFSPPKRSLQDASIGQDKDSLSSPAKQSRQETEIGLDQSDSLSSPTKQSRQETEIGLDHSDSSSSPEKSSQPGTDKDQDNVDPLSEPSGQSQQEIVDEQEDHVEPMDHEDIDPLAHSSKDNIESEREEHRSEHRGKVTVRSNDFLSKTSAAASLEETAVISFETFIEQIVPDQTTETSISTQEISTVEHESTSDAQETLTFGQRTTIKKERTTATKQRTAIKKEKTTAPNQRTAIKKERTTAAVQKTSVAQAALKGKNNSTAVEQQEKDKLVDLFLSVGKVVNSSRDRKFPQDGEEEEEEDSEDDASVGARANLQLNQYTMDKELESIDNVEMLEELVDDPDMNLDDDIEFEGEGDADLESEPEDQQEEEGDSDNDADDDDFDDDLEIDGEDLDVNLENLMLQNTNYKDFLKGILGELTQELENNQRRQQEVELLLQEKEAEMQRRSLNGLTKHAAVAKKALSIFGYPYFKDDQMYFPPPNKDVIAKRRVTELDVWIDAPKMWTQEKRQDLLQACRHEALYKRLHRLFDEREELNHKMRAIGVTDVEKEILEEQLRVVNHELRVESNIPDDQLFGDRFEDFDWMAISKKLHNTHDKIECKLQWMNQVHPSINKARWSTEEDEDLKQLAEATDCREWDDVAVCLATNRTAIACFKRFMTKHVPVQKVKTWSSKEDERLLRLVHHTRINFYIPWSKVHYYMSGRTKDQCNQRFMNSLREGIRHGLWHETEEWLLIAGQLLYDGNSKMVCEILPTRSNVQIYCHWNNYMKGDYKPWSREEDILLLESVKKYGVEDWQAVARAFNDEARNRTRCRHRFEGIYRIFDKFPATGLDNLMGLDTNKQAARRRTAAYISFEKKFDAWALRMNMEPVLCNIPVQGVDLDGTTVLPNNTRISNHTMSKFIRHLQTLLPPVKKPTNRFGSLPPPKLRRFPDEHVDPLPLRPLKSLSNPLKLGGRGRGGSKLNGEIRMPKRIKFPQSRPRKSRRAGAVKSAMDSKIEQLFRPAFPKRAPHPRAQHSETVAASLSIATKNLDGYLDFSDMLPNLSDDDKLSKFNKGDRQILESYKYHSDITADTSPPPSPVKSKAKRKARSTYKNRRRKPNNNDVLTSQDDDVSEITEEGVSSVECVNMVPPTLASVNILRGVILHAEYTARIARFVERDPKVLYRKSTHENAAKVLRFGIKHPEIIRRVEVGRTLFTPIKKAKEEDMAEYTQQVAADRKLVSRILKLLYVPCKMSIHAPDKQQSLFDDLQGEEYSDETEDIEDEDGGSSSSNYGSPTTSSPMQKSPSVIRIRNLSTLQDQPLNLSLVTRDGANAAAKSGKTPTKGTASAAANSSIYQLNASYDSPTTPSTRTYSKKRKSNVPLACLQVNFNDIMSAQEKRPAKKAMTMSDLLRNKTGGSGGGEGSQSQAASGGTNASSTMVLQPATSANVQQPNLPQGIPMVGLPIRVPVAALNNLRPLLAKPPQQQQESGQQQPQSATFKMPIMRLPRVQGQQQRILPRPGGQMYRHPPPPLVSTVNVPIPNNSGVNLPPGINALPLPPPRPVTSSFANLPTGVTTLSVPVNNGGSLPPGVANAVPVPHEVVLRMLAQSAAARSNQQQQ